MKIKPIRDLLAERRRKKLYSIMRGHETLKKSGNLGVVDALKSELYNKSCIGNLKLQTSFLGNIDVDKEVVIRQFLTLRLIDAKFSEAILFNVDNPDSSLNFPLPPAWREVVKRHGFRVDKCHAKLLWAKFIFSRLLYGAVRGLVYIFKSINNIFNEKPSLGRYLFFAGLTEQSLPKAEADGSGIFNWYYKWDKAARKLDSFTHNVNSNEIIDLNGVKVRSISSPVLPLGTFPKLVKYILWFVQASINAAFGILSGNWWKSLMLSEVADARMIFETDSVELGRKYFFHNSNWAYRPLWTYEAEKKGSEIVFYFYSTNVEHFAISKKDRLPVIGWAYATWPTYLVWDNYQKRYLEKILVNKPEIIVAGPISFHRAMDRIADIEEGSVAVFDVQPVRDALYKTFAIEFDYFTPETCNNFLLDVTSILNKYDLNVYHKRKRNIGNMVHVKYRHLLKVIEKKSNYHTIDPDCSAQELIEKCSFTISMPFTSTAIIAANLGKPSCYYDPCGLIQTDDQAAHGIPIISGPEQLDIWIAALLTKKMP